MTTPIHRWKERVTYGEGFNGKSAHWTFDGKPCWLASGLCDRNGVEIYEGDIVILDNQRGVVRFTNAQFYIDRDGTEDVPFTLNSLCSPFVEVIGHIAEETQ